MIYNNFKKTVSKVEDTIPTESEKRIKKDFEGYDHMPLMAHQSHDK